MLATARTRAAIQRKWDRIFATTHTAHGYEFMGMLTRAGLTNYHGEKLGPAGDVGRVVVRMFTE